MRKTEEYELTVSRWQVEKLLNDFEDAMADFTIYIRPAIKYKLLVAVVHIVVRGTESDIKKFEAQISPYGAIHT